MVLGLVGGQNNMNNDGFVSSELNIIDNLLYKLTYKLKYNIWWSVHKYIAFVNSK